MSWQVPEVSRPGAGSRVPREGGSCPAARSWDWQCQGCCGSKGTRLCKHGVICGVTGEPGLLLAHCSGLLCHAPAPGLTAALGHRVWGRADIQALAVASGLLSAVAALMEGQKAPGGRFVAAWPQHRAGVLRHGHAGALAHGRVGASGHQRVPQIGAKGSPLGDGSTGIWGQGTEPNVVLGIPQGSLVLSLSGPRSRPPAPPIPHRCHLGHAPADAAQPGAPCGLPGAWGPLPRGLPGQ